MSHHGRTSGSLRVGIDTGGTFTDFVTSDGRVLKRPSCHAQVGAVLSDGLAEWMDGKLSLSGLEIIHGTTVGTNALLTDEVATVGLLVTRGFADLLHLGRQTRPSLFDLQPERQWQAPDRRFVAEVSERLSADGSVVLAPDPDHMREAAERLVRRGAQSLAVCFLHSYRNASHEKSAARALRGIGVPVTLSSDLSGEMREFERFSTAYANGALRPLMKAYMAQVSRRMAAFAKAQNAVSHLSIMQSSGGLIGPTQAKVEPVRMVLSGPAGGVLAAHAHRSGRRSLMTLDMGGTSTDVCLLDGLPPRVSSSMFGGRPLAIPIIDIHTVGAGGGSIARSNSSSVLEVGPVSAGATPGPACYGNDGPATVTDANVFLGRIPDGRFLGGAQSLDSNAAGRSIEVLAAGLGLSPESCALGVIAVAEAAMARALRTISLERGHDPRGFSLMAFGGAGPLHAAPLIDAMGMQEALIPENPGAFSAVGLLGARPSRELASCVEGQSLRDVAAHPNRVFASLEGRLIRALKADGISESDIVVERFVDLRFDGQGNTLTLPLTRTRNAERFIAEHSKRFGFVLAGTAVELINLRARVWGQKPPARRRRAGRTRSVLQAVGVSQVGFACGRKRTPVYDRGDLPLGQPIVGPAIVAEYSSTTLIPPLFEAIPERGGLLSIRRGAL